MSGRRTAGSGPPGAPGDELVCPGCGARYGEAFRFCQRCGLPLVLEADVGVLEVSPRHAHARKIKPQLAEGALVQIAHVRNQVEAEFVQGLLLEEGVPSLLRRSAGFDVPDFLAAGPRDVLVPESGAVTAREVLLEAEVLSAEPSTTRPVGPARLLAGLLIALAIGGLVVWLVFLATR